jgi:hypothetical protein
MTRYGFSIKTRTGQRVDNVSIMAATRSDAERRLNQMYVQCEITHCRQSAVPRRFDTLDVASVISLLSAADAPDVPGAAANDVADEALLRWRTVGAH